MQPNTPAGIEQAARSYGVAPGGKAMMQAESRGAQRAIASGVYIVWRSCKTGADCARVGDTARCICGHSLAEHAASNRKLLLCTGSSRTHRERKCSSRATAPKQTAAMSGGRRAAGACVFCGTRA